MIGLQSISDISVALQWNPIAIHIDGLKSRVDL